LYVAELGILWSTIVRRYGFGARSPPNCRLFDAVDSVMLPRTKATAFKKGWIKSEMHARVYVLRENCSLAVSII